jgi:polysaccharide export outer membrane protein/exopolysaccharide production protein ExoF
MAQSASERSPVERSALSTLLGRRANAKWLPQPQSRRLLCALFAALVLSVALLPVRQGLGEATGATGEYRLGPQDKLRLSVYEWRPSRDEVFEWKALNAEYVVNIAGRLAVPLIGEIPASGLTTTELALQIAQQLRKRLGFATPPDISVEIVQHRPFYVTGHIEKAGEYSYRPGLTVLQAVAIAGGRQRTIEPGLLRLDRETIAARGELQLHSMEMDVLLARTARLSAELKGESTIAMPRVLLDRASETNIGLLLSQEELIHVTRMKAFDNQIAAMQKLKDQLKSEVDSVTAQIAVHDKQVASMKRELGDIKGLVARGLSTVSRQGLLERAEAQLLGDRLRLESNLVKARQEMSRTEVAILELRSKRSTETATELRLAQQKLAELAQRMDTTETLIQETHALAPLYAAKLGAQSPLKYTIVRVRNGQALEIAATESFSIEPGDTLKVEMTRPESAPPKSLAADAPDLPSKSSSAQMLKPGGHAKF